MTVVDIRGGTVESVGEGVREIRTKITPDPTCSLGAFIKVVL